jgi:putative ABC transport system permease protein
MVDRLRALPGVTAVGAAAHLPLSSYAWTIQVRRSDAPLAPGGQAPTVGWRFISWDYFGAMGIPVQYGRIFTAADTLAAQPVGILNETMARQYFGDPAAAVGRSVAQYGGGRPGEETVQVIGVVGDVRHLGLDQPPTPELFRPLAQTFMFPMAIVLRTSMPPAALAAAVRSLAYEVDPVIPVAELQPYTRLIAGQLARPRLLTFLLGLFGVSGLALVAVALYGVAAYRVRQREPEFGIRLALGADAAGIARGVLAQGLLQSAAGVAVGLPAALALSGVMSSVIFGVTARDPLSFAAVAIAVVAFTLAGCYLPARRAASVDPMTALRRE